MHRVQQPAGLEQLLHVRNFLRHRGGAGADLVRWHRQLRGLQEENQHGWGIEYRNETEVGIAPGWCWDMRVVWRTHCVSFVRDGQRPECLANAANE